VISCDRIAFEDAALIYDLAPDDELRAGAAAARNRNADPRIGTYLVDRNVNYTNVCVTDCTFCEFFRPPGHAESYVLSRDELAAKIQELLALGGTRILMQGGHNPALRIRWYEELLRWIRATFPGVRIDAFSPSEIEHLAELERMTTFDVLARLQAAGLAGLPGGGGEILDDEIRHRVSPKKTKTADWLRIMGEAHELALTTTVTMVFGFGEETRHRMAAFENIRRRQDESLARFGRGFVAFAAWPLQHESRFGAVHGGRRGLVLGADEAAYLRHVAFARCYLDNVPHFQASWPTMGIECAGQALAWGCDDMGGTMMEENVVSQAGSTHCSMTEAALRAAIARAGLQPRKRDTAFCLLPEPAAAG
jgi:cyclic dehypoxanthinyl futalosine synthase